jgi:PPM family protein phosphatase
VASEPGQGGPQFNRHAAYAGSHLLMVASGIEHMASPASPGNLAVDELRRLDTGSGPADLATNLERGLTSLKETFTGDARWTGTAVMFTAMLWHDRHALIAHVGGTRAYLLRGGALTQLTHDHALGQALVTRWLDGEHRAPPEMIAREARRGDRYLLATSEIEEILSFSSLRDVLRDTTRDLQDVADEIAAQAFPAEEFHSGVTVVVADVVDRARASQRIVVKPAGPGLRT